MNINSNTSAIIAANQLSITDAKLSTSTERLSSGYKINHAMDNPSGIAIAKRMNAQLRGLKTATQNANDAVSVVEIAEGALSEIQAMTQRINELSIKSGTGTVTDDDRQAIQKEVDQLSQEIERLAKDTDFNGQKLLNGDCDLKGYSNTAGVKVPYYSDETPDGNYTISSLTPQFDADGNLTSSTAVTLLQDGSATAFPADATVTYEGNKVVVKASEGFEVQFSVDSSLAASTTTGVTLDLTGNGAMRVQLGANEGQVLELRIPEVSLDSMGLADLDLGSEDGAKLAMDKSKAANDYISELRARLGAYQNRLERATSSLSVTTENVTGAYSRIMDVDMAEEMTEYTTYQVLSQAGISMLTQANERPQQTLQLLQ